MEKGKVMFVVVVGEANGNIPQPSWHGHSVMPGVFTSGLSAQRFQVFELIGY